MSLAAPLFAEAAAVYWYTQLSIPLGWKSKASRSIRRKSDNTDGNNHIQQRSAERSKHNTDANDISSTLEIALATAVPYGQHFKSPYNFISR